MLRWRHNGKTTPLETTVHFAVEQIDFQPHAASQLLSQLIPRALPSFRNPAVGRVLLQKAFSFVFTMDYIREFDIKLDREMYYAGESLSGHVVLNTTENFKLRSMYSIFKV